MNSLEIYETYLLHKISFSSQAIHHFENCLSMAHRSSVFELYMLFSIISYYKQIHITPYDKDVENILHYGDITTHDVVVSFPISYVKEITPTLLIDN